MGFRMTGGKPPKKSGMRGTTRGKPKKRARTADPHETVLSEETGNQGQATVRIVTRLDPAVVARKKKEREAAAARAAQKQVAPRRTRARARMTPQPPPEPEAPREVAPPAAPPAPEAAPAPQLPTPPAIPVRLLEIRVDGEPRPLPREGLGALLRQFIFQPVTEAGELRFGIRPEAVVDAKADVVLKVANEGPPAMVALMGFEGTSMRAAQATMGSGVEMEVRLEGALNGHIEISYTATG